MQTRDIVVVGASAGGVFALATLLSKLGCDFGAGVLIAQHLSDHEEHHLPAILQRHSQLEVRWAEQGDRYAPGLVLVAPQALHMTIVDGHIQLLATERENFVRPSIDQLFRSAAELHGARTVGVLLTGMLDDGARGLQAIHEASGFTIVEDPNTAQSPELPRHALARFEPDRILSIEDIGPALCSLVPSRLRSEARP